MNTDTPMTDSIRDDCIRAAIQAFDLCGSMLAAARDCALDNGLTVRQFETIQSDVLVAANERIRASVRP
jgi:hypothetical protein